MFPKFYQKINIVYEMKITERKIKNWIRKLNNLVDRPAKKIRKIESVYVHGLGYRYFNF